MTKADSSSWFTPFVELCKKTGSDLFLVQGAGGNISYKSGERGKVEKLVIKASGFRLKQVSLQSGWAEIDLSMFRNAFERLAESASEHAYSDLLLQCRVDGSSPRPSMELGFHAVLPQKWVVHVHSIGAQLVAGDEQGFEEFKRKFQSSFPHTFIGILPPILPGLGLAISIQRSTSSVSPERPVALFLKNHGLVVGAETDQEVFSLLSEIEKELRNCYHLAGLDWEKWYQKPYAEIVSGETEVEIPASARHADDLLQSIIFPDFAMMLGAGVLGQSQSQNLILKGKGLDMPELIDRLENLVAALILVEGRKKFGLVPGPQGFIGEAITSLPSEKEREKQMKGSLK